MGLSSSHESGSQSPTSPTHNEAVDLPSPEITTNVTPTASIKRNTSKASKSLQNSWKTPQQQQNHHVRQASVRSRAAVPMPDHSELDKRFAKVLVSFFFCFFFGFILFELHLQLLHCLCILVLFSFLLLFCVRVCDDFVYYFSASVPI